VRVEANTDASEMPTATVLAQSKVMDNEDPEKHPGKLARAVRVTAELVLK